MSAWVAIPGSHLGRAGCCGCAAVVVCVEDQALVAKCADCARLDAGVTWESQDPTGAWHPTVGYESPGSGAVQLGLQMPAEAHPEPLVGARVAREVEIPGAARAVRKLAEASGWTVRATYALGWVLGSRGETRALTHSLALRMRCDLVVQRETLWVVAVWSVKEPHEGLLKLADRGVCEVPVPSAGWKFDLGYGWGGGQPHHKLSAVALKETIKGAQS